MTYTPRLTNRLRVEETHINNTVISLLIHGDNKIITTPIDIGVSRPYFVHDVQSNITYLFGKREVSSRALCDVLKAELEIPDKEKFFRDATCIEFYAEHEKDVNPRSRIIRAQTALREAITIQSLPILLSRESNFINSKIENNHPYTQYLVLKPDTSKGYTHIEIGRK